MGRRNDIPNWPPSKERLATMIQSGMKDTHIGKKFGVHPTTISKLRKSYGLLAAGQTISKTRESRAIERDPSLIWPPTKEKMEQHKFLEHLNDYAIGKRYGVPGRTVAALRVQMNIDTRGRRNGTPNEGFRAAKRSMKKAQEEQIARGEHVVLRRKDWRTLPKATSFESVEDYLARGGKVTICEPLMADHALYLSRPHIAFKRAA